MERQGKDIVKKEPKKVLKPTDSVLEKQNYFVEKLRETFATTGQQFTEYQKRIGMSAVMQMERLAKAGNKTILDYPPDNIYDILMTVVGNGLDPLNNQIAIISSWEEIKYYDENKKYVTKKRPVFSVRMTARGHIELVRKRASGIKAENPITQQYVVYEGDVFENIKIIGTETVAPNYEPKNKSNKVLYVVYGLNMLDGKTQWVVAHRERIKPSIIAQMINNGVPTAETQKIWDLSVDEILDTYADKTFLKEYEGKDKRKYTNKVNYLNPTWRLKHNRESMVETKLRGVIGARMVDITFDNEFEREAFDRVMIEEKYEKPDEIELLNVVDDSQDLIEGETGETENPYVDDRNVEEVEFVDDEIEPVETEPAPEPTQEIKTESEPPQPTKETETADDEPKSDLFGAFNL